MAATDKIISQPESVIEKPQIDNVINTSGREKQLRKVKSSDSSTSTQKKNIVILGDSMITHANCYKVSKTLENYQVLIRSISGSKVKRIEDHMKPSISEKPDHMLHIGSNDLNSDDLAITMKSNSQNIIFRTP